MKRQAALLRQIGPCGPTRVPDRHSPESCFNRSPTRSGFSTAFVSSPCQTPCASRWYSAQYFAHPRVNRGSTRVARRFYATRPAPSWQASSISSAGNVTLARNANATCTHAGKRGPRPNASIYLIERDAAGVRISCTMGRMRWCVLHNYGQSSK